MSRAPKATPGAQTTRFDFPPPGVVVVHDPAMGRCLQAERDFGVGVVLFTEPALVYASFEENMALDEDRVNSGRSYFPQLLPCHFQHGVAVATAHCYHFLSDITSQQPQPVHPAHPVQEAVAVEVEANRILKWRLATLTSCNLLHP